MSKCWCRINLLLKQVENVCSILVFIMFADSLPPNHYRDEFEAFEQNDAQLQELVLAEYQPPKTERKKKHAANLVTFICYLWLKYSVLLSFPVSIRLDTEGIDLLSALLLVRDKTHITHITHSIPHLTAVWKKKKVLNCGSADGF